MYLKLFNLLHCNALRQISWLVHIAATHNGDVVCEELEWHYAQQWGEWFFGFRYFDNKLC